MLSENKQRIHLVEAMTIHPKVIEGAGQELFLATHKHYVEKYLVGDRPVSKTVLRNFACNLTARQKIADELGATFLHMVAPDKQSVYHQQTNIADLLCLGEVFQQQTNADFFYPLEPLREAAASRRMYFKNDLHWNANGVLLVLGLLLEHLKHPNAQAVLDSLSQRIVCKKNTALGLGTLLMPPRVEDADVFNWKNIGVKKASNHQSGGGGYGQIMLVNNPTSHPKRILAFGDSFMLSMIYALSSAYSEILFVRSKVFHADLMRDYQPDILLTSNAEGYLCRVEDDRHALPMSAFIQNYGAIERYDAHLCEALKRFMPAAVEPPL